MSGLHNSLERIAAATTVA